MIYASKHKKGYGEETMRKTLSLALAFVMVALVCVPTVAENPVGSETNPEILYEQSMLRGRPGEPTTFFNLAVRSYNATGEFRERLLAAKYFDCNADGEIYVAATVTWPEGGTYLKTASIQIIELDTDGQPIKTHSASGTYSNNSITVSKRFTDLEPDTFYIVAITKTVDEYKADLRLTVSH